MFQKLLNKGTALGQAVGGETWKHSGGFLRAGNVRKCPDRRPDLTLKKELQYSLIGPKIHWVKREINELIKLRREDLGVKQGDAQHPLRKTRGVAAPPRIRPTARSTDPIQ